MLPENISLTKGRGRTHVIPGVLVRVGRQEFDHNGNMPSVRRLRQRRPSVLLEALGFRVWG